MIKIYKNDNDELECHVKYDGYDFKFQCVRDGFLVRFLKVVIQKNIDCLKVISILMTKF